MSDLRIMACGGGHPTRSSRVLFEAGLDLTGVSKPKILVVPTAKTTREAHDNIYSALSEYGTARGLGVLPLHGFGQLPDPYEAAELLDWADAVYVTGGDTVRMMFDWHASMFTDLILHAVRTGEVTAIGTSAGMLAWFEKGHTDSQSYRVAEGESWSYGLTDCLSIFEAVGCPHYDTHHPQTDVPRAVDFHQRLRTLPPGTIGIGLDNSIGMQVVGTQVSVVSTGAPGFITRTIIGTSGTERPSLLVPGNTTTLSELLG